MMLRLEAQISEEKGQGLDDIENRPLVVKSAFGGFLYVEKVSQPPNRTRHRLYMVINRPEVFPRPIDSSVNAPPFACLRKIVQMFFPVG